jgi:hypothetical protein
MGEKYLRWELIFNSNFSYSCKYRENMREEVVKKLKDDCLQMIRASLKKLSEYPDDKLLELLDKDVFEISQKEYFDN